MKTKAWVWIVGIVVVISGVVWLLSAQAKKPGKYDTLAQCITDKGAKFYGAWWCPHCQAQKAFFGRSAKKLPYIECQTPDQHQNQTCNDAKIEGYPTWVFADGTRVTGEQKPDALAAKTGCALPQ